MEILVERLVLELFAIAVQVALTRFYQWLRERWLQPPAKISPEPVALAA